MAKKVTSTPEAVAAPGVTSTTEESKVPVITNEGSETIIKELQEAVKAGLQTESDLRSALESAHLEIAAAAVTNSELREQLAAATFNAEAAKVELENLKGLNLVAGTVEETETGEPKTFVEYQGRKYGFTERAPKQLNIDGQLRTKDELLNDEDAMISLIVGESAFVKQVF